WRGEARDNGRRRQDNERETGRCRDKSQRHSNHPQQPIQGSERGAPFGVWRQSPAHSWILNCHTSRRARTSVVKLRRYRKTLFGSGTTYRLSSRWNCGTVIFGIACCALLMMTLPNGARSRTLPAYRIAAPPQHGGRAYHVSPTGSDSNPGSEARPFKTIQKA